jgi:hypothetical protein
MLRVRVELVPLGDEASAREIATATIGNLGGTPLHADYRYRLSAEASPYAPAVNHEGVVSGHSRRQTVWALVWAALEDWWVTDGYRQVAPEEAGKPWLRALLEADGTVLQFSHGPWRLVRVGDADWLLLRGPEAWARWSDLDADAARERLLAVMVEEGGPSE